MGVVKSQTKTTHQGGRHMYARVVVFMGYGRQRLDDYECSARLTDIVLNFHKVVKAISTSIFTSEIVVLILDCQ